MSRDLPMPGSPTMSATAALARARAFRAPVQEIELFLAPDERRPRPALRRAGLLRSRERHGGSEVDTPLRSGGAAPAGNGRLGAERSW